MSKILFALSLMLGASAGAASSNDPLHLNVFNCHRKAAPQTPSQRGWGDIKELRFFAELTDGPKSETELKGLVEVEFYGLANPAPGDQFRVLAGYQLNAEPNQVGLKGALALASFLGGSSDRYEIAIPTFDPRGENAGDIAATVTAPQGKQAVDFVCRLALQK